MKILIIGGKGTIGKVATQNFKQDKKVIVDGGSNGDVTVDIADSKLLKAMFEKTGKFFLQN